jgi:hypothetical protein
MATSANTQAEPAVEPSKKKNGEGFRGGSENINRKGRLPSSEKKLTNRDLRERELLMLLRKIRPHVSDAIIQAARIMKSPESSDTNVLKSCVILTDAYRRLTLDLYDSDDMDAEGTEVQQDNSPVFSLRMINTEENKV